MNQPTPLSEKKTVDHTPHSLAAKRFLAFLSPDLPLTDTQQHLLTYFNGVNDEEVNQPGFRKLPILKLPEELFPGGYIPPKTPTLPPGKQELRQDFSSSLSLRCAVAVAIFCAGFMAAEFRPLLSTPQTITPRSPTLMAINNVTPLELVEVPGAAVSCPVAKTIVAQTPPISKKKRFVAKRSKKKALAKNHDPLPFLTPTLDGLVDTSSADLFPLDD